LFHFNFFIAFPNFHNLSPRIHRFSEIGNRIAFHVQWPTWEDIGEAYCPQVLLTGTAGHDGCSRVPFLSLSQSTTFLVFNVRPATIELLRVTDFVALS
jgi:hypothetical protein